MRQKSSPYGSVFVRRFVQQRWLVLMTVPALATIIIFHYFPLYGIIVAFKNYKPAFGILGSDWVGLRYFEQFFQNAFAWRIIRNTLFLSLYSFIFSFPAPIVLALLLNEVQNQPFKKVVQTISYLPHFISTVIMIGLLKNITAMDGIINRAIEWFGGTPITFMSRPEWFRTLYIASGIWQGVGWGTIIYLAAITNVNSELYEAARVDGANRWQQCLHVTLPCIRSTIVVMLIMQLGKLMGGSFERIVALSNAKATEFTTTIPVLVYKWFQGNKFSESTALGLFQSVIGVILVIASDRVAKKLGEDGLL